MFSSAQLINGLGKNNWQSVSYGVISKTPVKKIMCWDNEFKMSDSLLDKSLVVGKIPC